MGRSNSILEKEIKLYTTLIQAVNPRNGRLEVFNGPIVPGRNLLDAQEYCYRNNLAYCIVDRRMITFTASVYENLN
jgi:hypothetical protein